MPLADWGLLDPLSSSSPADDDEILAALVRVEQELTGAWADVIGSRVPTVSLAAEGLDLAALAAGTRAGGNPVIPLVPQLRAQAEQQQPGAGDWVHRGATSQDILDSALMLVASSTVMTTRKNLLETTATLAALADDHRHSIMVGRTLTQHAAPITFGVKVSTWLDGVVSAIAALDALAIPVQLAGAVGTGAAFADLAGDQTVPVQLRAALAARLGLADPARSWQAERTPVAALAAALATAIGTLGHIAADLLVLARTEVGEVSEGSGGGSSAMPQKQNPTAAVLLRSAALQSPGLLATVFSSLVSDDERPSGSWHAEWLALRSLLRLAVEASAAAAAVVPSLVVDTNRMRENLGSNGALAWAEQAQSVLTASIGRADAAALVARAVAAVGPELPFGAALAAELDGQVVDLSPDSVYAGADVVIDAALARSAHLKGHR